MFQRTCHGSESTLATVALAIRRGRRPAGVRIARVAELFRPACKALAKVHIMPGASRPADPAGDAAACTV